MQTIPYQIPRPRPAAELPWCLAVDGGGSGTRARLWSQQGALLGEGAAGPSGLSLGATAAWLAVESAAAAALQQAGLSPATERSRTLLSLGLAGANVPVLTRAFLGVAPAWGWLVLAGDGQTALLGAHGGRPGLLLAAGTGSVALAWLRDGRWATAGGWGFPAGDEGSGAWLGLRAMALAQQALDGRTAAGPLARAVWARHGQTAEALLAFCAAANQSRYAQLAPLVFEQADADPEARALLQAAAQALQAHLQALDPLAQLPLALAGSVAQRLRPWLPAPTQARCVAPEGDAVDGARRLALVAWQEAVPA